MNRLRNRLLLWIGLPILTALLYLGISWVRAGEVGFPLDDAWIHHTFARSLALQGEMTFNPGEPSAGSTAPLWTTLLAIGHRVGAPEPWSYALGVVCLMACGWLTWRLAERLFQGQPLVPWVVTATVLLEWHMAWAAVSGMETLLFVALSLGLVEAYLAANGVRSAVYSLGLGLLGGLLCLTRPEGVLLVGLIGLGLLLTHRWGDALRLGLTCAATVAPGLWLNWQATGGLLPDTFAAKTVYVAKMGWQGRLAFLALAPLAFWAGSLLLVIPAALWGIRRAVRADWRRHWLPLAWSLGLVALYAWRLPVLYHHARYLIPVVPWVALYGTAGLLAVRKRGLRRSLLALNGLVLLIFWLQGANIYSWNVDNIQDQQVAIGRWLAGATDAQAVVAATDVGAVGYFGGRRVVDLEGLVTPEVNRLRRARISLVPFLREQGVEYVVLYRDEDRPWLWELTLVPVFTATLDFNTISATDQMTVYRVMWDVP